MPQAEEPDKAGYKYWGVRTLSAVLDQQRGSILYHLPEFSRDRTSAVYNNDLNGSSLRAFCPSLTYFPTLSPFFLGSPPELTTYIHLLVLGSAIGKPNLRQKPDAFVY